MITLRYEGFDVGRIERGSDGWRLSYDARWLETRSAFPASLGLPLQDWAHSARATEAWLTSLAPAEAASRGVDAALDFAVAAGEGLLGALQFSSEEVAADATPRPPETPGASRFARGRPVARGADGLYTLERDAISTHLLYLEPRDAPGDLENRAFCAALGRKLGVEVASVEAIETPEGVALIEARIDRARTRSGRWIRVHAEDFANALGRPAGAGRDRRPARSGEGLTLADLFELADHHLGPEDRLRLLDAVIFSALIGDPEFDAKRCRALLTSGAQLAPFTSFATYGPWRGGDPRLAQRIPRRALRPEQIAPDHWRALAEICRLNKTFTIRRVEELGEAVTTSAEPVSSDLAAVAPALRAEIIAYFARETRETAARVLHNLTRERA